MVENIKQYLTNFAYNKQLDFFNSEKSETKIEYINFNNEKIPLFVNEYWTAKQRKSNSIHEISYRACFKAQLPDFFIELLTGENDLIYDPFSGRGTTVIEAALHNRNVIANDINPISKILSEPRLFIPSITKKLNQRLTEIPIDYNKISDIDLSMFYHPKTESEIVSIKEYLEKKGEAENEDYLDKWIRMIATNRLTGHSSGFFSVYTLPPNQAVSPDRQKKINEERNQTPTYRDVKKIILRKSNNLLRNVSSENIKTLKIVGEKSIFLSNDARNTPEINSESVSLTVTSPPFLDVVQYDKDNWLRCWFNSINLNEISKKITIVNKIEDWSNFIGAVFEELYRITKPYGWVTFEVGEVRKGKIKLEEYVLKLGLKAGFKCEAIMINAQDFTKTANIWGINNMNDGTNTNRIVIFQKNK